MTETIPAETCTICHMPGPLLAHDPVGGGTLCLSCRQLVSMGPEWINSAIHYLKTFEEKKYNG